MGLFSRKSDDRDINRHKAAYMDWRHENIFKPEMAARRSRSEAVERMLTAASTPTATNRSRQFSSGVQKPKWR